MILVPLQSAKFYRGKDVGEVKEIQEVKEVLKRRYFEDRIRFTTITSIYLQLEDACATYDDELCRLEKTSDNRKLCPRVYPR